MPHPPATPEDSNDPRWGYAELSPAQAHAAWPCATCRVRRDEHADQPEQSAFPSLDITDHPFTAASDLPANDDVDVPDDASALLDSEEEKVPVVIAVHNGLVVDGRPMFVPSQYSVPVTKLLDVQRLLSPYEEVR